LRYDEAAEFFIREMELKRKYREIHGKNIKIIRNSWFRQQLSLIGLYYHFSTYGESIVKPIIIGAVIVGLSTLFWLIQNNPTAEPSLSVIASNSSHISDITNFINKLHMAKTNYNFINSTQIWNNTHTLKAFERSLADFLPLLQSPSNIKVGIIDFIVKIVGGGLTFVLGRL